MNLITHISLGINSALPSVIHPCLFFFIEEPHQKMSYFSGMPRLKRLYLTYLLTQIAHSKVAFHWLTLGPSRSRSFRCFLDCVPLYWKQIPLM